MTDITDLVELIGDRVAILRDEENLKTKTGFQLIKESSTGSDTGVVVATGPGRLNREGEHVAPPVKVGDHVRFRKYGHDEAQLDGRVYLFMNPTFLIAIEDAEIKP